MLCVSFVNGGYLNIESGLEQGLELGLEPGLERKMTSSDLDG
jgi:hypothetical protein